MDIIIKKILLEKLISEIYGIEKSTIIKNDIEEIIKLGIEVEIEQLENKFWFPYEYFVNIDNVILLNGIRVKIDILFFKIFEDEKFELEIKKVSENLEKYSYKDFPFFRIVNIDVDLVKMLNVKNAKGIINKTHITDEEIEKGESLTFN